MKFTSKFLQAALPIVPTISMMKYSLEKLKEPVADGPVKWKELWRNPEYRGFCERVSPILDKIRGTNPSLSTEMIETALKGLSDPEYSVSYTKWKDRSVSYREVEETVMQINKGAQATEIINNHPHIRQWLAMIAQGSASSSHPVTSETVGWLRVDEVNQDYLLVDEIQSDLISAIAQAKNIVESQTFQELEERYANNPKLLGMIRTRMGQGGWRAMKQMLLGSGLTGPALEVVRVQLTQIFKDWAEVGLATLLKIAKEQGIKWVLINTEEVFKRRDPNFGSEKYKVYYQNLVQKQGFKLMEIDTPMISGKFWGRKP